MENIVDTRTSVPIPPMDFSSLISEMQVEDMSNQSWVILDATPSTNILGFTVKQLVVALRNQKADAGMLKLYEGGRDIDPNKLSEILHEKKPTHILWDGPGGWRYWNVLKNFNGALINTWFDDPVMRIDSHQVEAQVREGCMKVSIFCWDGYWKDQFMTNYGIMTHDIHLAALPNEYYTSTFDLTDDLVFIGNLHSSHEIQMTKARLPLIFRKVAEACEDHIRNDQRISSWDVIINRVLDSWSKGDQQLFKDIADKNSTHLMNLRWFVWVLSKNTVRIRMLQKACKIHPVRMFAETKQLQHASVAEIQSLVGCYDNKLIIKASDSYKSEELCQLYHYGILNLQATDPQSMCTGIPYRVFQCMASGKPLLTDYRWEWKSIFKDGEEMFFYDLEPNQFGQAYTLFEERLEYCLSDKDLLKEVGINARQCFENKHTWKHRIKHIDQMCSVKQLG